MILHKFSRNALTDYDMAIYDHIRLIDITNDPICIVEDSDYRSSLVFRTKTNVSVNLNLVV